MKDKNPYGWQGCPLNEKHPAWPYVLALLVGIMIMTGVPAP